MRKKLLPTTFAFIAKEPKLLLVALVEAVLLAVILGTVTFWSYNEAGDDPFFVLTFASFSGVLGLLVSWYALTGYVTGFGAAMLTTVTLQKYAGEPIDYKKALQSAWKVKSTIFYVTTVDVFIGWLLRLTELTSNKMLKLGRIFAGTSWSAARSLAVPAAVSENLPRKKVLARAKTLAKTTWVQTTLNTFIITSLTLMMIFLVGIPVVALVVTATQNTTGFLLAALTVISLGAGLNSLITGVLNAHIYVGARNAQPAHSSNPGSFKQEKVVKKPRVKIKWKA